MVWYHMVSYFFISYYIERFTILTPSSPTPPTSLRRPRPRLNYPRSPHPSQRLQRNLSRCCCASPPTRTAWRPRPTSSTLVPPHPHPRPPQLPPSLVSSKLELRYTFILFSLKAKLFLQDLLETIRSKYSDLCSAYVIVTTR